MVCRAAVRSPLTARLSARRLRASSAERRAIVRLRLRLPPHEIVREAAISAECRDGRAELLGAGEIGQRRLRLAIRDRNGAHAGLRKRAARIDLIGPGEETRRGLRVAEL